MLDRPRRLARRTGADRATWLCATVGAGLVLGPLSAGADTLFVSTFHNEDPGLGAITRYDLPSPIGTTVVTGLTGPEDGACSPSGYIYFAEPDVDRLTMWDQTGGGRLDVIPRAGVVIGPEGPTFDAAGNLYFNTKQRGAGDADGAWMVTGGNPVNLAVRLFPPFTQFGEAAEVVRGGPHQGSLLLVDRVRGRVLLSEPIGAPLVELIAAALPSDQVMIGAVTNECGQIFVSTIHYLFPYGRVYQFNPQGGLLSLYADGIGQCAFADFDSQGNLYVADTFDEIWKVTPARVVSVFARLPGEPTGLAICRTQNRRCGESCLVGALTASSKLLAAKQGVVNAAFVWTGDALAFEHHLNSVAAKRQVPSAHRPPSGVGTAVCSVPAPLCTAIGIVTAPPTLLFFQAFSACGPSGVDEGP